MLSETSRTDVIKLGAVLVIAAAYAWIVQSGLAALGVIVLSISAAAAIGVCSLIGLPTNLLSTHILPFVTVGISLRDMFLMLSSHLKKLTTPEVLQRTGPSIIMAALVNSSAFLASAILPVPALRVFCLQCAILVIFHAVALLFVFPCVLAMEQRCRKTDVPCFRAEPKISKATNNNNDPVSVVSSNIGYYK